MRKILTILKNKFLILIGKKRKLKGCWTLEKKVDLEHLHGFEVEQELADTIAAKINDS